MRKEQEIREITRDSTRLYVDENYNAETVRLMSGSVGKYRGKLARNAVEAGVDLL